MTQALRVLYFILGRKIAEDTVIHKESVVPLREECCECENELLPHTTQTVSHSYQNVSFSMSVKIVFFGKIAQRLEWSLLQTKIYYFYDVGSTAY